MVSYDIYGCHSREDAVLVWQGLTENISRPGSVSQTGFAITIQIRWKFRFTLTSMLIQWSRQFFVHGTTTVLSCKNCCYLKASNRIRARQSFHRIWIADKKNRQWNGSQHIPLFHDLALNQWYIGWYTWRSQGTARVNVFFFSCLHFDNFWFPAQAGNSLPGTYTFPLDHLTSLGTVAGFWPLLIPENPAPTFAFGVVNQGQSQHHDDVTKWKHFPRYWPFVRGIHRSPVNSPHKCQCRRTLFDLGLNQQLSKEWRHRCF